MFISQYLWVFYNSLMLHLLVTVKRTLNTDAFPRPLALRALIKYTSLVMLLFSYHTLM